MPKIIQTFKNKCLLVKATQVKLKKKATFLKHKKEEKTFCWILVKSREKASLRRNY